MGKSFEAWGIAEGANTDTHGSSTLKQERKKNPKIEIKKIVNCEIEREE